MIGKLIEEIPSARVYKYIILTIYTIWEQSVVQTNRVKAQSISSKVRGWVRKHN